MTYVNGYLCKSCTPKRGTAMQMSDAVVPGRGECWCRVGYGSFNVTTAVRARARGAQGSCLRASCVGTRAAGAGHLAHSLHTQPRSTHKHAARTARAQNNGTVRFLGCNPCPAGMSTAPARGPYDAVALKWTDTACQAPP